MAHNSVILTIILFTLVAFALLFLKFHNRNTGESDVEPRRIKRSGQHSTIYFLLDKSNGNVKFGRAVNFDRRFKTHLTSNRDLKIIRTFPETETFNETLIKRKFGQNEWVPFTNELKRTIVTGKIK